MKRPWFRRRPAQPIPAVPELQAFQDVLADVSTPTVVAALPDDLDPIEVLMNTVIKQRALIQEIYKLFQ
jgi:hypothetical protein